MINLWNCWLGLKGSEPFFCLNGPTEFYTRGSLILLLLKKKNRLQNGNMLMLCQDLRRSYSLWSSWFEAVLMSANILKSYAKKTILLGAPSMDLCNFYCFMGSESRVSWHFMCFRGHIQVKVSNIIKQLKFLVTQLLSSW